MESEKTNNKLYCRANEAFVAEDYKKAIELYTQSLQEEDPSSVDCLVARAHAYIKTEEYEKAKADATSAIDIARRSGTIKDPKAFLRSGVASFHLGKYQEAKKCFQEGLKIDNDPGLRQWTTWCDEKMKKLGINPEESEKSDSEASKRHEKTKESSPVSDAVTTSAEPLKGSDSAPVPAATLSPSKIKHDWYQTEAYVIVEIRIKHLKADQVSVDFTRTSLSVSVRLTTDTDYNLELDLCHPINVEQSSFKVMATKIEVKMKKAEGFRWAALEGDGSEALPAPKVPEGKEAVVHSYPSSSGKNWNKIEIDIQKELADEKPEGEAALNEMFQKIYAEGSDEVRRAMNKSFQESGGTVLSTNWQDIRKDKVEVKPPDGMEFKKW